MKFVRSVFSLLLFMSFLALTSCDSQATIVNNLKERDANEIVVLLVSQGIDAQKVEAPQAATGGGGGAVMWNIAVPAQQITDALAVLNASGLPRNRGTTLLDLFGDKGLVPSEMQDKVRFQEGLSEQLGNMIRMMDGVVDASVQITFPQSESEENPQPLTASVLVIHKGVLDNPNSMMVTKIKRLVSSALPGLSIDNVSVIVDRSLTADVSVQSIQLAEDLEYVSIWGIIIARASAGSFQVLLYVLLVLIFLLAVALIWISWKFSPFLMKDRGYLQLLNLHPIALESRGPEKGEEGEDQIAEGETGVSDT